MPVPGLKKLGIGQIHVELLGVRISDENVSLLQRALRNLGPISFIALGGHASSLDDSTFSSIVAASHVENALIMYSAITDDGIRVARQWKGLQVIELQKNSADFAGRRGASGNISSMSRRRFSRGMWRGGYVASPGSQLSSTRATTATPTPQHVFRFRRSPSRLVATIAVSKRPPALLTGNTTKPARKCRDFRMK
jgi:hypothetical protein